MPILVSACRLDCLPIARVILEHAGFGIDDDAQPVARGEVQPEMHMVSGGQVWLPDRVGAF